MQCSAPTPHLACSAQLQDCGACTHALQRLAFASACRCTGRNFSGWNLEGANFRRADLSNADLRRANLTDANLSNATLSNAKLDGATLARVDIFGHNLEGVHAM